MTAQVTAAIVVSQDTVSPPGGYVSGSRDDLVQGKLVTLTNLSNGDAFSHTWTISPTVGREPADYGITGDRTSSCTLTPPISDGWGDLLVTLRVVGPPLPNGTLNVAEDAVILRVKADDGFVLPHPKEAKPGNRATVDVSTGFEGSVCRALLDLKTNGAALRQSHADAVLWYTFDEASGGVVNHGTRTSADLSHGGTPQREIAGPLGKATYLPSTAVSSGTGIAVGSGSALGVWAWVTLLDIVTPRALVRLVRTSDSSSAAEITYDGGFLAYSEPSGGAFTLDGSALLASANTPTLIAFTFGDGKAKLLIDGIEIASTTATGTIAWSGEGFSTMVIANGGVQGRTVYHEIGAVDRVMTQAEINEIFRRGMGWRA